MEQNHTYFHVSHFVFNAFPGFQDGTSRMIIFAVFLMGFTATLFGNLIFLTVMVLDNRLHVPMYYFIGNLAVLDLFIPSATIPEMLYYLISDDNVINFGSCVTQMTSIMIFRITESCLLGIMAYDRYQAVCWPLHYPTVMTNKQAVRLSACCWVTGIMMSLFLASWVFMTPFCGPNKIDHYCCELIAITALACADVTVQDAINFVGAMIATSVTLLFIGFSYGKIGVSVLKVASSQECWKAYSTCTSHLFVITIFYLVAAAVFISYRVPGFSIDARVLAGVVQNILPPLVNPLIYCLKTKEVRVSLLKSLKRMTVVTNRI
ncbi:olfactory receptor 10A3-like [Protopterus annectens]|uniref:olfactory receptor 10A3-like n=1 Tax=Protopterus annectens TaxID=7888 RepID=UPI001CF9A592|nr:olfactory receptor 10A3-like [Protopterus annectens]